MTFSKDHIPEEIRHNIMEAAKERFRVYGFNKTTMAEIAKDCDMSAANLYRFFDNKLDIGVNLASACLGEKEANLNQIITGSSKPASERFREYIIANLHYTHRQSLETPRISELVSAICQERMDLVKQHMERKIHMLASLIEAGNDSGEFAVSDPRRAAEAILTATALFDIPSFTPFFSLETLEKKAAGLTELLLKGLLRK